MYALLYAALSYLEMPILWSNIPAIVVFMVSAFRRAEPLAIANFATSIIVNSLIDTRIDIAPMNFYQHLISVPYLYFCFIVQSTLFYFSHRLLHKKWFFAKIHSLHHYYITEGWWTAFYVHPAELALMLITFQTPKLMSFYIPIPYTVVALWNIVSSLYFMFSHGKYEIVALRNHWLHHKHYNCNYSSEWIDRLFGTYFD